MDIYQETALLLLRKPPQTLFTFEPWVFLQEVMLGEMLRENSCKAWAVAELCSDLLLTFGFLTVHINPGFRYCPGNIFLALARLPGAGGGEASL